MKKLFIYSLLAISSFILPACGDDEKDKQDDPTPITIEGKWYVARVETSEYGANGTQIGNTKSESLYPNQTLTFTAPSQFKEERSGSNPAVNNGNYSLNGSELLLSNLPPSVIRSGKYDVDSLTASRLVFKYTLPATSTTNKYIITYRSKR